MSMNWVEILIVGLIGGWAASHVMKSEHFGLLGNLLIGIVGAFVGVFLVGLMGWQISGIISGIVVAFVGSIVVIYIVNLVR